MAGDTPPDEFPSLLKDVLMGDTRVEVESVVDGSHQGSHQEGTKRRLFSKIVRVSPASLAKGGGVHHQFHDFWFVIYYDEEAQTCKVAHMIEDGTFGRGSREGRVRWKVSPDRSSEVVVSASSCYIVNSKATNKTSDIDKETWDILEDKIDKPAT